MKEHVDRYVDALLRRRRPKPFAPTQDEVRMVAVAIDLAAGAEQDAAPRPAFVDQLRRRIEQQQRAEQPAPPRPAWRPPARRRFLAAGALTVSGAAAGAAGMRLFAAATEAAPAAAPPEPDELTPAYGSWQAVADSRQLSEGAVLPFETGPITGFVCRTAGRLRAVSGICTHQGCRLELTAGRDRLACPCHGATFTLAGANLTHPHLANRALPALPRVPVREQNGHIEIYAPTPPPDDASAADDSG